MTRARVPDGATRRAMDEFDVLLREIEGDIDDLETDLAAHEADAAGAHAASAISNTPAGNIVATTVQAAIDELDSEKQPLDATLTAFAGVTFAADKGVYATGADAFATFDLSAFARTLLDDANAAAARTTLGLVIGTDVQAQDAELAAIAGLISAADRIPYFTGLGTAALATFTSQARTFCGAVDAAAQRTVLGLGNAYAANVVAAQADSAAATLAELVTDFNDLLAAMRTSGILAT